MAVLAVKPAIDFEEPIFGQIQEIYVVNLAVYFYIQILETTDYCEHYCTFITKKTPVFKLVDLQTIASYLPLSPHSLSAYPGSVCLIPKFIIR
jgi:hypothetical protein